MKVHSVLTFHKVRTLINLARICLVLTSLRSTSRIFLFVQGRRPVCEEKEGSQPHLSHYCQPLARIKTSSYDKVNH